MCRWSAARRGRTLLRRFPWSRRSALFVPGVDPPDSVAEDQLPATAQEDSLMLRTYRRIALICCSLVVLGSALAIAQDQPKKKGPPPRPAPTVADFAYGKDSQRQKFDFWQA